MNLSW